ncbi:uncharacterized protein PHALS_03159 [Plasmopara halstedii]|uniref:Uncharacterized protein n=1 Tax=Plasmopara halstedii TaxID=4781 RepID=A0A0P1A968_PLAHL|nr:uncharacterized protein PHALS_03159 [Plasmopara halstedii]CEG36614.1 hypothetical protein PHALS_03159 [Plasmopara halstedii]|eukprot:XP_024572983.1 hypothetical protein PHALS_03159 [Plasmopara halstedii]
MMEKKEDANPSADLSKHSIDPPPVQVKKEVSVAGCFVTLKEGGELANEISIVDCGVGRSIKYSHYILYLRTASLVNAGPIPHHSRNMSAVGVFYFSRSFSRDHSVGELHLAQDPIVKACWLLFVDGF